MKFNKYILQFFLASLLLWVIGCKKSDNLVNPPLTSNPSVNLSVSFTKAGSVNGLLKASGTIAADSLRIDSAIVVFARIKFESHVDTVMIDSTENAQDDNQDMNVTFRGPFVVHIRDTVAIDFADQILPAGTYDGIKFKIHQLQHGENREDSDEHNGHPHHMNDSITDGSSIIVWGSVFKSGSWTPFTFKYNGELEFKLKGTFIVTTAVSSVNISLNFNMGLWFKDPHTGTLLDPTDQSGSMRNLFREAIRRAFESGRGGRDDNHDGHPDI
jgi:hypothetical protein